MLPTMYEEPEDEMSESEYFDQYQDLFFLGNRRKGTSLLILENNYTVIDIETTGLSPMHDEIIELSAIRVRDNQIIEEFTSLVKPENEISDFITRLTGITNEMVKSAPTIKDAIMDYVNFIGDSLLLGHNIHFDINFIYDNCWIYSKKCFNNNFVDTLMLSRKVEPRLLSHKLGGLASHYSIKTIGAHRGLADCHTTHMLYGILKEKVVSNDIDLSILPTWKKYPKNISKISSTVETFNEEHPLYGKNIVFPGELEKMSRGAAAQTVANLGGMPQSGVNKKTDFLILGNNDYNKAIKGGKSSKQRKAEEYILSGQDLQIISETEFYEMI